MNILLSCGLALGKGDLGGVASRSVLVLGLLCGQSDTVLGILDTDSLIVGESGLSPGVLVGQVERVARELCTAATFSADEEGIV